jgi:hypothetical protein
MIDKAAPKFLTLRACYNMAGYLVDKYWTESYWYNGYMNSERYELLLQCIGDTRYPLLETRELPYWEPIKDIHDLIH